MEVKKKKNENELYGKYLYLRPLAKPFLVPVNSRSPKWAGGRRKNKKRKTAGNRSAER